MAVCAGGDGAIAPIGAGVPPILDGIVGPSVQMARDLCPFLAKLGDQLFNELALFRGDGQVVERRLEVLVVPLATLFGRAQHETGGDAHPIGRAMLLDEFDELGVFQREPWAAARDLQARILWLFIMVGQMLGGYQNGVGVGVLELMQRMESVGRQRVLIGLVILGVGVVG